MTPLQQEVICAAARSYIDTPWLGQGRSHQGIDCIGVIVMSFRACFTVDEGRVDYTHLDPARMMRVLLRHCRRLDAGEAPQPADAVIYGDPVLGHVGMLVDGPKGALHVIHSPQGGRVVETTFDPKRGPVMGVFRWRL